MRWPLTVACAVVVACGGGGGDGDPTGPGGGGGGGGTNRLTATINGSAFSAASAFILAASVQGGIPGTISFQGSSTAATTGAKSIAVNLGFIPGPGTYPLGVNIGTTPGGVITYVDGSASWLTPLNGASGSITIASITTSRITGSFIFTAEPTVGGGAAIQGTNGSFDVPLSAGFVPASGENIGSTLTATIGGAPYVGGTVVGSGGGTSTRIAVASTPTYTITLTVGPITEPGGGPLTGATVPLRRVRIQQTGTTNAWGGNGGDTGTLTVTSISAGRIAGTFSGTLQALPGTAGPATLTVANGTFNVRTN